MRKTYFKQIPKDAKLLALGNFFRSDNVTSFWRLATSFRNKQQAIDNIKLNIETACILGVGREFVQEENFPYTSMKFTRDIILPDINTWVELPLGRCPRLSNELANIPEVAAQKCFVFEFAGSKVWLPKFELARKLFFHTGFLARAAFTPNGLAQLFTVIKDEEKGATYIKTQSSTGVPAKYIRHQDYRQFFTWLMLNPEAKESFETIWGYLCNEQVRTNSYWRWQFNFNPPSFLTGLKITARGPFNKETGEMLVWELAALHNLPNQAKGEVEFFHPKIKKPVKELAIVMAVNHSLKMMVLKWMTKKSLMKINPLI